MGADIHVYCEYRHPDSNWDDLFNDLYLRRKYAMFAALADVRNNGTIEVKIPPRGLPTDLAWKARDAAQGPDWHSHSYMTLAEWRSIVEPTNDPVIIGMNKGMEVVEAAGFQTRIVFWFDN